MSTRTITDNLLITISKGPLLIFLTLGLGLWQASKMTDKQVATIEHLVGVLNNVVGLGLLSVVGFLILYATILWPIGRFISSVSVEFFESQRAHAVASQEHHAASKAMYHEIQRQGEEITALHKTIKKFFEGKV